MEILSLDLQDQSFVAPQQFIDEVDPKSRVIPELVSLPDFLHPHQQDKLSSTVPARSPNATTCRRWGQRFHTHGTSWPIPMTPESTRPTLLSSVASKGPALHLGSTIEMVLVEELDTDGPEGVNSGELDQPLVFCDVVCVKSTFHSQENGHYTSSRKHSRAGTNGEGTGEPALRV